MPDLKTKASLSETAAAVIRDKILDLSLEPGQRIEEKWLSRTFKGSRTPIREAVNRLAAEDLVEIHANRGAFVRSLDLAEIEQLFEAYRVSERLSGFFCNFADPGLVKDVARMQARHRRAVRERAFLEVSYWNAAFRTRIARSSGNRYVADFCERMNNQMRRLGCYVYRMESRDAAYPDKQLSLVRGLHEEMLAAIRAADRPALIAALDKQVAIFRRRVADAMATPRGPDFTLNGRRRRG